MKRQVALLGLLLAGTAAAAEDARAWRGWDRYQAIMWSTGAPRDFAEWIARLRQVGFTAEQSSAGADPAPYAREGFSFYVENMVPELGFVNNRRAIYDADYQGYITTRDKAYVERKPPLDDPAFWQAASARVAAQVRLAAGHQPLAYQLRDELSVGAFINPIDYCFSPHTLRELRQWLRDEYGSLDALNREWETGFAAWDDVTPMTTYEAKARERAALAAGTPENYAPWSDHRAFMDWTFARSLDRFRGFIASLDGNVPVGVEGTQMPAAFGGYDLWRMSQTVDWVEPYDINGSREVFRSFLPQGTPIVSTVFGSDFNRIRQKLWWLLLHGDRGAIVWDDDTSRSIEKNREGQPLTARGEALTAIFRELKAIAPTVIPLRRLDDRIAIHYSQASIRAHWMFDSREDRDTWPRRFSSYEAAYSRFARVRDSFQRVIEDLGLQYNFVSYEQIEKGELLRGGYKALLLPQSTAMSAAECREIEAFVRAGGTVIADNMTATMNERARRLPQGQLDGLFGIERSGAGWRARPAGGTLEESDALQVFEPEIRAVSGTARKSGSGVAAVIESSAGSGRTVYLNLDMHQYGRLRLRPPQGEAIRELFGRILRDSGIEPEVTVRSAEDDSAVPCVEVWRYRGTDGDYVAVMRNPEFNTASLQQDGYPDNAAIETAAAVRIRWKGEAAAVNLRTGETAEPSDHLDAALDPWSPILLRLKRE